MLVKAVMESQNKSFLATSLALAPTVWMLSFNFGVYGTVFYEHLFVVWAISLTALICGFVLNLKDEHASFSSWVGRFLLVLPTLWVLSGYWSHLEDTNEAVYLIDLILTFLTVLLSLPYILYHLVFMLVPGAQAIYSTKLIITLFLLTLLIGSIGFLVGSHHRLFLYCQDFEAAGNKVPENCLPTANGE